MILLTTIAFIGAAVVANGYGKSGKMLQNQKITEVHVETFNSDTLFLTRGSQQCLHDTGLKLLIVFVI